MWEHYFKGKPGVIKWVKENGIHKKAPTILQVSQVCETMSNMP